MYIIQPQPVTVKINFLHH